MAMTTPAPREPSPVCENEGLFHPSEFHVNVSVNQVASRDIPNIYLIVLESPNLIIQTRRTLYDMQKFHASWTSLYPTLKIQCPDRSGIDLFRSESATARHLAEKLQKYVKQVFDVNCTREILLQDFGVKDEIKITAQAALPEEHHLLQAKTQRSPGRMRKLTIHEVQIDGTGGARTQGAIPIMLHNLKKKTTQIKKGNTDKACEIAEKTRQKFQEKNQKFITQVVLEAEKSRSTNSRSVSPLRRGRSPTPQRGPRSLSPFGRGSTRPIPGASVRSRSCEKKNASNPITPPPPPPLSRRNSAPPLNDPDNHSYVPPDPCEKKSASNSNGPPLPLSSSRRNSAPPLHDADTLHDSENLLNPPAYTPTHAHAPPVPSPRRIAENNKYSKNPIPIHPATLSPRGSSRRHLRSNAHLTGRGDGKCCEQGGFSRRPKAKPINFCPYCGIKIGLAAKLGPSKFACSKCDD